ncbi:MAG: hypothetical protein JOY93_11330 [Acidobacteriales bacterium]|nr:hypothetical protein [Terriglobales bacterium]
MGWLVLIDVLGAIALVGIWYLCFERFNHRKGALALRWVEAGCSNKGTILDRTWKGNCKLQARVSFASHWFENARITVRLLPRPIPVHWLLSVCRKQRETVTFEADLDCAPSFQLEIFRHRWLTHKDSSIADRSRDWSIIRPGPVILTTRTEWTQELTPVVNTLMTSRGHYLLTVRFRSQSPHFAATIPLEAVSDAEAAASFLNVLRELATGASTSHQ